MSVFNAEPRVDAGYYQQQVQAAQAAQQQQQQHMAHAAAAAAQMQQPTQQVQHQDGSIVLLDAYGQQAGYWPAPHAPRMSAAAVRAANMSARQYWDPAMAAHYGQQQQQQPHPHAAGGHAAPWTADAWGRLSYQQQQQQHQQHQHQQHQLMLHSQLAKLQAPQQQQQQQRDRTSYDQATQYAAEQQAAQQAHAEQANNEVQEWYEAQSQRHQQQQHRLAADANQQQQQQQRQYAAAQPQAQQGYGAPAYGQTTAHVGGTGTWDASRQQQPAGTADGNWYHAAPPAAWAPHAVVQHPQQQSVAPAAVAEGYGAAPSNAYAEPQMQQQAQQQQQQAQWQGAPAPAQWAPAASAAAAAAAAAASQTAFVDGQSAAWGNGADYEAARRLAAEADARAPPPSAEATPAAPADGPAPPSPNTLDKSSLPLSALGAEIIWNTCAALLEPELVVERRMAALSGDESRKPSSSASSSPMIVTPVTSPAPSQYSYGVQKQLDAMAGMAPMERTVSHNNALVGGASLLHRLAVEGASSAMDGGNSSAGSSASTSEPGTPPSMSNSDMLRAVPNPATVGRPAGQARLKGLGLGVVPTTTVSRATSPMDASSPATDTFATHAPVTVPHRNSRSGSMGASARAARATALGVLRLVSPEWRFSVNDDNLPSLVRGPVDSPRVARPGSARPRRRSSAHGSPREPGLSMAGAAAPGSEVSPAFRRFAHQVLAQTLLSPTAFMLAMLYAIRVPYLAVAPDGEMDEEVREIFANPPSAAPFKLFTLGLMIANKHLDDATFLSKTWHEVTGIPLVELNRMEAYYLERCSYEVTVPEGVWIAFLKRFRSREEYKLATAAASVRRSRSHVPTRSVHGAGAEVAQSPAPTSAASEEVSRRLIAAADEALLALGQVAPLELSQPALQYRSTSTSPLSGITPLPPMQEQQHDTGRMRRPSTALHYSHHHCRSAPAGSFIFTPSTGGSDEDVFEDDESPYRPQGGSSAASQAHSGRPSFDATLARSQSDWSAGFAQHATHAFDHSARGMSRVTQEAPLAPSVLLALLNRL